MKTFNTTTRTGDVIADHSSRGPTWYDAYAMPDLVAPGHRLPGFASTSQVLYQNYPALHGPSYGISRDAVYLSGTGMATGLVSGSVALSIEAPRTTFGATPTPNTIKAMLMRTALPMSDASGQPCSVLAQGAGAANPAGALQLAQAIDPKLPVGDTWLVNSPARSTTVDGENIVWGGISGSSGWSMALIAVDEISGRSWSTASGRSWPHARSAWTPRNR